MVDGALKCIFARSTKAFKEDSKKGVFCIDLDLESGRNWPENLRLSKSEDWFKTSEVVEVDSSKHVRGFIGMGSVQSFIVAAVKSIGTEELALYVTDDGEHWDRARFPDDHGGIMEEAYTILPSTTYAIQVDVLSSMSVRNQIGTLFTSNSNGSYFTRSLENTNRNNNGIVDFEKVQNIEGILLANIVSNHEEVRANPGTAEKQIESRISFDDGTPPPMATKLTFRTHLETYQSWLRESPPPFRNRIPQRRRRLLLPCPWHPHGRRQHWRPPQTLRPMRLLLLHGRRSYLERGPRRTPSIRIWRPGWYSSCHSRRGKSGQSLV